MSAKRPPRWFRQFIVGDPSSEYEWIPENVLVTDKVLAERKMAGWKFIDQKNNRSPTAAKGYGRHWVRSRPWRLPFILADLESAIDAMAPEARHKAIDVLVGVRRVCGHQA